MARYRVITNQYWGVYLGPQVLNVFHYECLASTATAEHLFERFISVVPSPMKAIQSEQVKWGSVDVINLDDPNDYFSDNTEGTQAGAVSGDSLPPYAAFEFKFIRGSRASRHGWKRVGGVPESSQANGLIVAGVVDAINAVSSAFTSALQYGTENEWYVPKICRRPPKGSPASASVFFPIVGVQFIRISTQNTRKLGRGT